MANSPTGESMISRVTRVLAAFDTDRQSLTISALARRVDLPLTTTHRLVRDLTAERILERGEDGRVQLGLRLWELASRGSATTALRHVALPFLDDVHEVVREHTTLGVLADDEVLYLERLSVHASAKNITQVAGRLPIHACSPGLVLLAHSSAEYQEEILARPLRRFTDQTITDPRALRVLLAEIRRVGHASVPGMIVADSTGIAVPVVGPAGAVVAALSVIVPRGKEDLRATVPALRTASRGISRALAASTQRRSPSERAVAP